jgi:flagellar hook-associated protein 2
VTDALTNVALQLNVEGGATDKLVFGPDADASFARLESFVTSYNSVMSALRTQINVIPGTDTRPMLTRDTQVRHMFRQLDNFTGISVVGAGDFKYLSDLGIDRDLNGILSIDEEKFKAAVKSNPTELEAFFSDATNGFGAQAANIVTNYTDSSTGSLFDRQDSIAEQITDLDDEVADVRDSLARMRERMVRQFTQMERVMSYMNSMADFLTSQEKRDTKST